MDVEIKLGDSSAFEGCPPEELALSQHLANDVN